MHNTQWEGPVIPVHFTFKCSPFLSLCLTPPSSRLTKKYTSKAVYANDYNNTMFQAKEHVIVPVPIGAAVYSFGFVKVLSVTNKYCMPYTNQNSLFSMTKYLPCFAILVFWNLPED